MHYDAILASSVHLIRYTVYGDGGVYCMDRGIHSIGCARGEIVRGVKCSEKCPSTNFSVNILLLGDR